MMQRFLKSQIEIYRKNNAEYYAAKKEGAGPEYKRNFIKALRGYEWKDVQTLQGLAGSLGYQLRGKLLNLQEGQDYKSLDFTMEEVLSIEKVLAAEDNRLHKEYQRSLALDARYQAYLEQNETQLQLYLEGLQENETKFKEHQASLAGAGLSVTGPGIDQKDVGVLLQEYSDAYEAHLRALKEIKELTQAQQQELKTMLEWDPGPSDQELEARKKTLETRNQAELLRLKTFLVSSKNFLEQCEAGFERCKTSSTSNNNISDNIKESINTVHALIKSNSRLLSKCENLLIPNVTETNKKNHNPYHDEALRTKIAGQIGVRQHNKIQRDAVHRLNENLQRPPPADVSDYIPYDRLPNIEPVVPRGQKVPYNGFKPIYFPDHAHTQSQQGRYPLYLVDYNQSLGEGSFANVFIAYPVDSEGKVKKPVSIKRVRSKKPQGMETEEAKQTRENIFLATLKNETSIFKAKFSPQTDCYTQRDEQGELFGIVITDHVIGPDLQNDRGVTPPTIASASFTEKLATFIGLVENLNVLHQHTASTGKAVVHGDLKGANIKANIKTEETGKNAVDVRILDHGLSVRLDHPNELSAEVLGHGTMDYVAPEVLAKGALGLGGTKSDLILPMVLLTLGANALSFRREREERTAEYDEAFDKQAEVKARTRMDELDPLILGLSGKIQELEQQTKGMDPKKIPNQLQALQEFKNQRQLHVNEYDKLAQERKAIKENVIKLNEQLKLAHQNYYPDLLYKGFDFTGIQIPLKFQAIAPYFIAFLERLNTASDEVEAGYDKRPDDETQFKFFSAFYRLCKTCEILDLKDVRGVPDFEQYVRELEKYAPNPPTFMDKVAYTNDKGEVVIPPRSLPTGPLTSDQSQSLLPPIPEVSEDPVEPKQVQKQGQNSNQQFSFHSSGLLGADPQQHRSQENILPPDLLLPQIQKKQVPEKPLKSFQQLLKRDREEGIEERDTHTQKNKMIKKKIHRDQTTQTSKLPPIYDYLLTHLQTLLRDDPNYGHSRGLPRMIGAFEKYQAGTQDRASFIKLLSELKAIADERTKSLLAKGRPAFSKQLYEIFHNLDLEGFENNTNPMTQYTNALGMLVTAPLERALQNLVKPLLSRDVLQDLIARVNECPPSKEAKAMALALENFDQQPGAYNDKAAIQNLLLKFKSITENMDAQDHSDGSFIGKIGQLFDNQDPEKAPITPENINQALSTALQEAASPFSQKLNYAVVEALIEKLEHTHSDGLKDFYNDLNKLRNSGGRDYEKDKTLADFFITWKEIGTERSKLWTKKYAESSKLFLGEPRSIMAGQLYEALANLNLNTLTTHFTSRVGNKKEKVEMNINDAFQKILDEEFLRKQPPIFTENKKNFWS